MRWWLHADNKAFSVDNALVLGKMDFSTLPSDLYMVHWIDGQGEIEYQDMTVTNPNGTVGANLNGLRTKFNDVIPYAPFFQQFLTLLPGLLLVQAQQVQNDLIETIFETKNTAPFQYTVGGTSYAWDADDSSIAAMSSAVIPHTIGAIFTLGDNTGGTTNSLVSQINANYQTWHDQLNANYGTQAANDNNQIINQVNVSVGNQYNAFFAYFNQTVLGDFNIFGNTINYKLVGSPPPGLVGTGIPRNDYTMPAIPAAIAAMAVSLLSVTAGTIGSGAISIPWLPSGGTVPVNLSAGDISGIMSGIASRRLDLQTTKNIKTNEVNALTTIAAVIAYDVTTGW
jgi:hypothetical protein